MRVPTFASSCGVSTKAMERGRPAAVFVIGFGQRSTDVSLYQTNLQNWLADSAFWTDMNTYVSDWTQEAYGDVRSWAVPACRRPFAVTL